MLFQPSGRDVPTLPGKPTDLVLRPRREDGAQISSHEARFLFDGTWGRIGGIRLFLSPCSISLKMEHGGHVYV